MTSIRLDMSVSLDGMIAGLDDRPGQEMGRGGFRLFNWLDDRNDPGTNGKVYAESMATGAIIAGRRTFEFAGRWNGDHHDGVPILVLTTHFDDDDPPPGNARFYTDVASCAADARAGAGDKDVMVHGAGAGQALPQSGENWTRSRCMSCRWCSERDVDCSTISMILTSPSSSSLSVSWRAVTQPTSAITSTAGPEQDCAMPVNLHYGSGPDGAH